LKLANYISPKEILTAYRKGGISSGDRPPSKNYKPEGGLGGKKDGLRHRKRKTIEAEGRKGLKMGSAGKRDHWAGVERGRRQQSKEATFPAAVKEKSVVGTSGRPKEGGAQVGDQPLQLKKKSEEKKPNSSRTIRPWKRTILGGNQKKKK